MEDVSDRIKISMDEPTIMCGWITDGCMVQITPSQARCCCLDIDEDSGMKILRCPPHLLSIFYNSFYTEASTMEEKI